MRDANRLELEKILVESPAAAMGRERSAFDAAAHPYGGSIVLFGAGRLGAKLLRVLRAHGIEPLAFSDNDARLWGQERGGLPILSPSDAAHSLGGSAVFVIAVCHPSQVSGLAQVAEQLAALGCKRIAPFVWLFWKYAEACLPHYLWDLPSALLLQRDQVLSTFELLADEPSRAEFTAQIRLRSTGEFEFLQAPRPEPQYFPGDLYRKLKDECFIDCGAFDGDTILSFAQFSRSEFRRIVAFEADPGNFARLRRVVKDTPSISSRTVCHEVAVTAHVGVVRFEDSGLASASVAKDGGREVPATTLDAVLAREAPTFIKMDIEGAEPDALAGARETIRRHDPLLAICVYHRQDHLWRVPALMREAAPEALLYLRPYCCDGFDTVCYGVPRSRQVD